MANPIVSSNRMRRVQPELAAHSEGTVDAKRPPLRRRPRPTDLSSVGPSADFTASDAFDAPSNLGQEPLHLVPDEGAALSAEDRLPVGVMDRRVNGRRHMLERNRLKSVLASLGDAVVAVDHAGRTLATNPAYDRLFGRPDAEIRPEDWPACHFRRESGPSNGRPGASGSGWSSRSVIRTAPDAGSRP